MPTRRVFNRLLLAGFAASVSPSFAAPRSPIAEGIHLGLESYSLSPLPHDGLQDRWIALMNRLGLAECNLDEPLIQPDELVAKLRMARTAKDRDAIASAIKDLNGWRTKLPLNYFSDMRKKFAAAGIRFAIFTPSGLTPAATDADLDRVCAITRALGAGNVSVAAGKSVIKRFLPLLDQYNLRLNIPGRPSSVSTDPDAIARPADYEEAVGYSPRCSIDIDIGDATGAGFEIMPFITKNHARIDRIELKDRKRDKTSMPWGQGDTPIKDVLLYVRNHRLPIRCYIDCDYPPATEERIASIAACRAYIRTVIESSKTNLS